MADKVRSFTLFEDQERILTLLSDEQCGKLLRCLYAFNAERDVEIADPLVQLAFWQISDTIARVKAFAESKKQAGQAGGKAKANAVQAGGKQNLAEPSRNLADESTGLAEPSKQIAEPIKQIAEPTSISVSISDSISISKKEEKRESKANKRFVPPTVEEVSAYCHERKNRIDPQHFCDYYLAQGWKLSNGQPLKDWKAAVRNWEARAKEKNGEYDSNCPECPEYAEWVKIYNEELPMLQPAKMWGLDRENNTQQSWLAMWKSKRFSTAEEGRAFLRRYFHHVQDCPFLMGQPLPGKEPFFASFDWLISPRNCANVIDGKYERRDA